MDSNQHDDAEQIKKVWVSLEIEDFAMIKQHSFWYFVYIVNQKLVSAHWTKNSQVRKTRMKAKQVEQQHRQKSKPHRPLMFDYILLSSYH